MFIVNSLVLDNIFGWWWGGGGGGGVLDFFLVFLPLKCLKESCPV